tara:strand:- start:130965 stop:131135 length:171 start_codon:yes stop_codon:yes gene_type:complete
MKKELHSEFPKIDSKLEKKELKIESSIKKKKELPNIENKQKIKIVSRERRSFNGFE